MSSIKTDNSILRYLQDTGIDNTNKREANVPEFDKGIALDWTKPAGTNRLATLEKLAEQVDYYSDAGMTYQEIGEVLLSEGNSKDDVSRVLFQSAEKKSRNVLPKSYDDIKYRIESLAEEMKPEDFFNAVTAHSNPYKGMVRLSDKSSAQLLSLLRKIAARGCDAILAEELHASVQPFFEEELTRTYLTTQAKSGLMQTAATRNDGEVAVLDNGEVYAVNINSFSCDCNKFQDSHMGLFGIPCEHIVEAYRNHDENGIMERIAEDTRDV
jgi:hypothetical protein